MTDKQQPEVPVPRVPCSTCQQVRNTTKKFIIDLYRKVIPK